MTQDEIIRMAREAGLGNACGGIDGLDELERFAALVAAHERERKANQVKPTAWKNTIDEVRFKEPVNLCQKSTELVDIEAAVLAEREACAKVCDEKKHFFGYQCAAAIRARGENDR